MGFDFSEMIEMIYERTSSGCLGWICSPAPRCQGMEFPSHMLAPSFHFLKPVSFTILLVGWDDKYIEMATCKLDVIFWSLFLDLIIHFNPTIVKQSEQSGEQTSPGLKQDDDALHLQRDDRLDLRERSSRSPVPLLLQRLHHRDLPALLVDCELVLVVSLKHTTLSNILGLAHSISWKTIKMFWPNMAFPSIVFRRRILEETFIIS